MVDVPTILNTIQQVDLRVPTTRASVDRILNPSSPTALERATEAAQADSLVSRVSLSGSNSIQTQIIGTRLDADITLALSNPAQITATYDQSVALVQEAQEQAAPSIDLSA